MLDCKRRFGHRQRFQRESAQFHASEVGAFFARLQAAAAGPSTEAFSCVVRRGGVSSASSIFGGWWEQQGYHFQDRI